MPGLYFDEMIATHFDRQLVRDGARLILRVDTQLKGYLCGLAIIVSTGSFLLIVAANIKDLLSHGDRGLIVLAVILAAALAAGLAAAATFIRASGTRHRFREILIIDPAGFSASGIRSTNARVALPSQTRAFLNWNRCRTRWELKLRWAGGEEMIATGMDTRLGHTGGLGLSAGPLAAHMLHKCARLTALGVPVYKVPTLP